MDAVAALGIADEFWMQGLLLLQPRPRANAFQRENRHAGNIDADHVDGQQEGRTGGELEVAVAEDDFEIIPYMQRYERDRRRIRIGTAGISAGAALAGLLGRRRSALSNR